MVFILIEPVYAKSVWCVNLLEGLTSELRGKRIIFKMVESLEGIEEERSFVYLIGSDLMWVRTMLQMCNQSGFYPILLCNQAYHVFDADYSAVCSDIEGSMRYMVNELHSKGKDKMAIYGINTKSASDTNRLNSFLAVQKNFVSKNIFQNNGSLEKCYQEFKGRQEDVDVVICVNNFAAISLVRKLKVENPGVLKRLIIIGCAEARLSDYYSEDILSMRVNFRKFGKAAISILENLKKQTYLSHIIMLIKCDIDFLNLPESHILPNPQVVPSAELITVTDEFYEDDELHEMMKVEHLLNESDATDRQIITLLKNKYVYETMAEKCFLTESSIKYRVKKMMDICEAKNKTELVALLEKYFGE